METDKPTTTWTIDDAIALMRRNGVRLADEATALWASYMSITDDIESYGGKAGFTFAEYADAIRKMATK